MTYKRTYTYNSTENNGYDPCDILLQHYPEEIWRTIVLSKEDFENLQPWKFCSLLNDAYEQGRKDAMKDLRTMIEGDATL